MEVSAQQDLFAPRPEAARPPPAITDIDGALARYRQHLQEVEKCGRCGKPMLFITASRRRLCLDSTHWTPEPVAAP
jgi:hypothetical protein